MLSSLCGAVHRVTENSSLRAMPSGVCSERVMHGPGVVIQARGTGWKEGVRGGFPEGWDIGGRGRGRVWWGQKWPPLDGG